MSEKDFKDTLRIFEFAAKGMRNDESLGEYLIDVGAGLIHLGVQEIRQAKKELKSGR